MCASSALPSPWPGLAGSKIIMFSSKRVCWFLPFCLLLAASPGVHARVVINEIMYHPVELAAFDPEGFPVLDLTEDVHEYIELFNPGEVAVDLRDWRLAGGVSFTFPTGARLGPGGFLVVAKDPSRLLRVASYGLQADQVQGPYTGNLGNSGDTLRLVRATGEVEDSVSYSAAAPWPAGADALGADDEWTGLKSSEFQYTGRSLERVSDVHPANDPANWLASPLAGGPSPGKANAVRRPVPLPVVLLTSAAPESGDSLIRSNQPVVIQAIFSAAGGVSGVAVEYYVENINATNETRTVQPMQRDLSSTQELYTAVLPGRTNRTVVRYRILADRGAGTEPVSPRADEPFSWHAYFVSPTRGSANPIYDVFVANASLARLESNINQSPRRITLPDPPGLPRASWNATEPAIFVHDGVVYDIRIRYHGSRYSRNSGRQSYKVQFPSFASFQGRRSYFITDKGDEHRYGFRIYDAADLPVWRCRSVDLYLNNAALLPRLQQEEMDRDLYERWIAEQAAKFPDRSRETLGGFYKSEGVVPLETSAGIGSVTVYTNSGEGPYYIGNAAPIPPKKGWTLPARYDFTWPIQLNAWRGGMDTYQMITDLWASRGDEPTAPRPNLATLREFLEANFDVDATLTYIVLRNWSAPFDNATHNHFLWRKGDGRWGMLPWDVDAEFSNSGQSMYWDQWEAVQPDQLRGPEWIKDSFLKAMREDYKRKAFILVHTLLTPTNLIAIGMGNYSGYAATRTTVVDRELGLGTWQAPVQPRNLAPTNTAGAFPPAVLRTSAYAHSQVSTPPAHAATVWVIRPSDGTYAAPVFRRVSFTDLTSLAIPFDRLRFGETYFWKVTYLDANGHPSLDSAETSFTYGPPLISVPLIPIDAVTLWRYHVRTNTPPANWKELTFDDSTWAEGAPLFADETGRLPEPIRTAFVRSNFVSFYFRKSFVFEGDPAEVSLRLRQVVDDGLVVHLNGREVWRAGMPAGPLTGTTPANRSVNDAVYEGPYTLSSLGLVRGTNVLAAEVHQAVPNGNDVVFGLSLEARVPASPGAVRLNEVLAANRGIVVNEGGSPDYIELLNLSGVPQPLDQFSLSDDPNRPGRYLFPAGTTIPPHGLLTVWCDEAVSAPGLHSGFELDDEGQTVALFAVTTNGYQLVDTVTYGFQVPDQSVGRLGGGPESGAWQLVQPSPGALNTPVPLGSPVGLRINEWLATAPDSPDWFELYNPSDLPVSLSGLFLSDDASSPTNTRIPLLNFIGAHSHRQFLADGEVAKGPRHVDFKLSGNGDSVVLSDAALRVIDRVVFGPQQVGVSEGRFPDGASTWRAFPASGSPGEPNFLALPEVLITEILGGPEGFIEIQNVGGTTLDLGGWWLSDEVTQLPRFRLPSPASLAPGGFLVLNASQPGGAGGDPVLFPLNEDSGGRILLSEAGGDGRLTGRRTSLSYGPLENGISFGRVSTSLGSDLAQLATSSAGRSNSTARVGPVVVSEIQYAPRHVSGDANDFEFLELLNLSSRPIPLFDPAVPTNGWRLRDAVSFEFTDQTFLTPGERVLLVSFDPIRDSNALSAFRATYRLPGATRLFGPFRGNLDNNGDSVEWVKPGTPKPRGGGRPPAVPEILRERIRYQDQAPWPALGDGGGVSLQRVNLDAFGNDPVNWVLASVSPGEGISSNHAPSVTLTGPVSGARFPVGATLVLAASASDLDGVVTRVDFLSNGETIATAGAPSYSALWTNAAPGSHRLIARAVDDRLAIADSAPADILVLEAPVIVTQPTNTVVRPGSNTVLRVVARSVDTLRYQWYREDVIVSAATNALLVLTNVGSSALGRYRVRVSDSLTSVDSITVSLQFLIDPLIVEHPLSQPVIAGQPVTLSVVVTNTATLPIGYRWRRNGANFPGNFFVLNSHVAVFTVTNPQPQFTSYSVVVTNAARSAGLTSLNANLSFQTDADGDGMVDAWEQELGFDPLTKADRNGDRDQDRSSNWEEFIAGTNPNDRKDFLQLELLGEGLNRGLGFTAVSNRTYSVLVTPRLEASPWELWRQFPASPTNRVWLLEDRDLSPSRYYRLTIP